MSEPLSTTTPQVPVPNFNRNPVASLRCWPYILHFGGEEFEFPALSAADWLALLMGEDTLLTEVLPGMLAEEDHERFTHTMLHSDDDLEELFQQVLEEASGRYWWVTLRLVGCAVGSWRTVVTSMIRAGVDPEKLSLAAWLDVFTVELIGHLPPDKANMLFMQIEMVPDGEEIPDEDLEMSPEEFLSLG